MEKKQRSVILSNYRFPCPEVDFEYLFAEELGKEFDVLFLLQGDRQEKNVIRWRNAEVLLSKKVTNRHPCAFILNKILEWHKLIQLYKLIQAGEVGMVLVRDLPLEALILARLKRFFPFMLCFQYSAPLGDINLEAFKARKCIGRLKNLLQGLLFNLLIGKALESSDLVFPISDAHKEALRSLIPTEKMVPVRMGVPENWANRELTPVPFLRELKENNFLLSYFGSMSFAREPQFMLRVFAEVNRIIPNSKLVLMGSTCDSWEDGVLRSICREYGMENNVIFTGRLDRNVLRDYLAYCDLTLCATPPKPCFRVMSPTKMYESLGCGIPVIANNGIPDQENVIRESGGGLLVDYVEPAFVDGIVKLIRDDDLRARMSSRGKAYVLEFCTYKSIAKRIAASLQTIGN